MSPRIAFFDLDRTLISVNSASLWVRRELRQGHLQRREALRAGAWLGLYRLGWASMEGAIRDAVASLAGQEEAELAARSDLFWAEEIAPRLRPGARPVVEAHRAAGDTLWLLTGSSPYLSRRAAEAFGLHGYSCNVFLTEGPRFTGEVATPLCYGRGKIHHAEQVAAERGLRLADCIFYTDSYSDAPAMEAFGEAVAVNPDPRLAALARRRGWRVERWGRS